MPFPDKGTNTLRIYIRILCNDTKQLARSVFVPTEQKAGLRDAQSAVRMSLAKCREGAR
ncbi:hypothetical protein D3C71_1995380 [compost metagenome]